MTLFNCFLLASLCGLSSWSASSRISLIQTPDLTIMEGANVSIGCCWTVTFKKVTLSWLKNDTCFKKDPSLMPDKQNCSFLTFTAITRDDSGTYVCMLTVLIPEFIEEKGNGSVITVIARDNTNNNKTRDRQSEPNRTILLLPVIIPVAVVIPLVLIPLAYFCILRRKRAKAARVIYEVPHIDSEEAEMDQHSTSSRGSSQWCQVPMYESLDYFEHVQPKEVGEDPLRSTS
ncbi:uncharacterized protein [Antennarius striatus]|uniref:uncharacterized protein isoform X1 n=1 Tax=Antennarius striatus TaxID=241820 RepID=UPI0035B4A00B